MVAPLTAGSAAGVVVDRTCASCGRPRLPGTGLHASISHSGAKVAVAVSNAGEVGVDVQQVEDGSVQELSPLVLADAEAGHIAVARDFFTYWTRKEALVKATGDGATVPLAQVVVSPPGTPPQVLGYPRPGGLAAQLRDLGPEPGYVGALAVLSPRPVTSSTTVSKRSASPCPVACSSPARAAAPAGSAPTPAQRARDATAASSRLSLTATMPLPSRRAAASTASPIAGRTTAIPSATVAAGSSSAGPAGAPRKARVSGWQRSACTPIRRGRRSARPQLTSSSKPLSRATSVGP